MKIRMILCWALCLPLFAQEWPQELDRFVAELSRTDAFSGSILIAKNDQVLFENGYGFANRETQLKNGPEVPLSIGSINKMFTSVAIAKLVAEGKLDYQKPVGTYLPSYPNQDVKDRVTLHHLLTHSSGLSDFLGSTYYQNPRDYQTVSQLLTLFQDESLRFKPGSRHAYSNAGFVLLGAIIEAVSGKTYADYVHQAVYQPAGMTNTGFNTHRSEKVAGYTRYRLVDGAYQRAESGPRTITYSQGSPGGGGYASVRDFYRFSRALLAGKIVPRSIIDVHTSKQAELRPGRFYGYGFSANDHYIGHNGGGRGQNAYFKMYRGSGYLVVVISNYDPPSARPVLHKIHDLLELPDRKPQRNKAMKKVTAEYAGSYGPNWSVIEKHGQVLMVLQNRGEMTLQKTDQKDVFIAPRLGNGTVTFTRNEAGRVTHMIKPSRSGGEETLARE